MSTSDENGDNAVGDVRVFYGDGSGGVGDATFTAGPIIGTRKASQVALVDLNGDGILDLLLRDNAWVERRFKIHLGNGSDGNGDGTFTFGSEFGINDRASDILTGDINKDGVPDLVMTDSRAFPYRLKMHMGQGALNITLAP